MSSFKTRWHFTLQHSHQPSAATFPSFSTSLLDSNIEQGFDRSFFSYLAESSDSMENLAIVKIVVSHRQTDLSTLGNKFSSWSNDKKVVQHIILRGIRILCRNSLPWVKKLLVDGDLRSDAMAKSFRFWHDNFLTTKIISTRVQLLQTIE
jgi:hypothetical protein